MGEGPPSPAWIATGMVVVFAVAVIGGMGVHLLWLAAWGSSVLRGVLLAIAVVIGWYLVRVVRRQRDMRRPDALAALRAELDRPADASPPGSAPHSPTPTETPPPTSERESD